MDIYRLERVKLNIVNHSSGCASLVLSLRGDNKKNWHVTDTICVDKEDLIKAIKFIDGE